MKVLLFIFLSIPTLSNALEVSDFDAFSGLWEITNESVQHRDAFKPRCRTNGAINETTKVFKVFVEQHMANSEFFVAGDISVTLKQQFGSQESKWYRAFDVAPISFSTDGRESRRSYFQSGSYINMPYTGSLNGSKDVITSTNFYEQLYTYSENGESFLVWERIPDADIYDKCVFKKIN